MDASVKLKLLLPMYKSVLTKQDVVDLARNLAEEKILKQKDEPSIDGIVDDVSSRGKNAILAFIFAIQTLGGRCLQKLTEKFVFKKVNDLTRWLIFHWDDVILCECALEDLKDYVIGIPANARVTANQWIEIVYQISCRDRESIQYLALQIMQNVVFDQKNDLNVDCAFDCFFKVLKPIFKSKLKANDYTAIADLLENEKFVSKHDAEALRCSDKRFNALAELISKNPTDSCLYGCTRIIHRKGFDSLAYIVENFFKFKNSKLLWMLVHWSLINDNSTNVFHFALQRRIVSHQAIPQGNAWIFDLMILLANGHGDAIDSLIMYLFSRVSVVKITISIQETKPPASNEATSIIKQDPQKPPAAQDGSPSENKAGAEQKKPHSESTKSAGLEPSKSNSKSRQNSNSKTGQSKRTAEAHSNSSGSHNLRSTNKADSSCNAKLDENGTKGNAGSHNLRSSNKMGSSSNAKLDENRQNDTAASDLQETKKDPPNQFSGETVTGANDSQENLSPDVPMEDVERGPLIVFHLIVDKKSKFSDFASGTMCVFNVQAKAWIPLTFDSRRNNYYGFIRWNFSHKEICYKYCWLDSNDKQYWEKLPDSEYHIVNRKLEMKLEILSNNSIHLYDVANFDEGANSAHHDFSSMYSRNVERQLDDIAEMQLSKEKELSMNFHSFCANLEGLWKYAKIDLKFDYPYYNRSVNMLASYKSELFNYIRKNEAYGMKNNSSFEMAQRVLSMLAVVLLVEKNQINFAKEKEFLRSIGISLSLNCINESDVKLIFDEISCFGSDIVEDVCQTLLHHIKRVKDPLHSLQLLPLFYVLTNNGNVTTNKTTWEKAVQEFDLAGETYKDFHDVSRVAPRVVELSKTFPGLVVLFQSSLPIYAALDMLNQGQEFVKEVLKPSTFLISLLSYLNLNKFEQYFGSSKVCDWIESYLDRIAMECQSSVIDQSQAGVITEMHAALVDFLKKKNFSKRKPETVVAFFRIAMKLQSCVSRLHEHQSFNRENFGKAMEELLHHIQAFIASEISAHVTANSVQIWNILLNSQICDTNLNTLWKSSVSNAIQDNLSEKMKKAHSNVLNQFENVLEKWNASPDVQACYSEAVFSYAMSIKYESNSGFFATLKNLGRTKNTQLDRLVSVFQRMFLDSWRKCKSDAPKKRTTAVLNFAVSSPFVVHFLRLFDDEEKKSLLKAEVKKIMEKILNELSAIESQLLSGEIRFHHLDIILNSRMNFEEVLALIHDNKEVESSLEMLIRREEELNAFHRMREAVEYLVKLVDGSDDIFGIDSLRELLSKDLHGVAWRDFVDMNWTDPQNIDVIFFSLTKEAKAALNEIYFYKISENEIVRDFWIEQANDLATRKSETGDKSQISDIESLWDTVKKQAIVWKHQIVSGTLVLQEVERLFGKCRDDEMMESKISHLVSGIYAFPHQDLVAGDGRKASAEVESNENEEYLECAKRFAETESETSDDVPEFVACEDYEEESDYSSSVQDEVLLEEIVPDEADTENIEEPPITLQNEVIDEDIVQVAFGSNEIEVLSTAAQKVYPVQDEVRDEEEHDEVDEDETVDFENETEEEANSDAATPTQDESRQFSKSNVVTSQEHCSGGKADHSASLDDYFQQRVDQICNYFALQRNQDVAAIFYRLKECLGLGGDFTYLDIVQEQKALSERRSLNRITDEVIGASKQLKLIVVGDVELVQDFLNHEDLIYWLRENMKDRGEVKVMSDLAMISAGENVKEVDMVSCFLSAVMGFAPFIFDLREDDGLNATIDAFEKICQASDRAQLKRKWDATADHFEWLKGIKDFHGSVEKSSLSRARDINCKGVYTIGGETEKIPAIENALKLTLPGVKHTDDKQMTLDDLHSLESRLMLIAGKAEKGFDDVKTFTDTLALVENMAKMYVKLKTAGCLLFNNWIATVRCLESSDDGNIFESSMEIQFDDHSPRIFTHENVNEELQLLTAVMENVYNRWLSSLDDKRRQFYQLNHFNIKQIMYLCQELAKAEEKKSVSDQVLTLLEFVKPDIASDELIALLNEATKHKDNLDLDSVESIEDDTAISEPEQKRRMVRQLVKECVSEKFAKAAVEDSELPLNYDDCIMKALEFEAAQYDDDMIEDLVKKFDKDAGFDAGSSDVKVIHSVVNDRSALTLQSVIAEIMECRDDDSGRASVVIKTVCERYLTATAVTSLNDCISIEHLGILLEKLFSKVDAGFQLQREFPNAFEKGKPNLVICQEHEMFSTLLSLYMLSPKQPLPSLSEVLLCSESTSPEEVEIFLRRAISSTLGRGIFSLAFANKLSFEVANAANLMINKLEKLPDHNPDYRLVVFCSSSQHYIASLLLENRVDYTVRSSPENIQLYLSEHLKVHECHQAVLSLPNRFRIQTSVLAVTSERAGMGKSLHIERWREHLPTECRNVTIRLLDKQLSEDEIMTRLLPDNQQITNASSHFIHFDITPSVQHGISNFMFSLMILGGFKDIFGTLWRRQPMHVYFLEYTNIHLNGSDAQKFLLDQNLIALMPTVRCLSPLEILQLDSNDDVEPSGVLKMDLQHFESDVFQRSYQYLEQYLNGQSLDRFRYSRPTGTPSRCIKTLLKSCRIKDPTWSELRHFASFLNNQLGDCEASIFCNEALIGGDSGLSGFKNFVVKFMIRMSQDFATPSSVGGDGSVISENEVFERHQLRRHWEEDVHPYLFFNEDHVSMTFLNFVVDSRCNLVNPKQTLEVLEQGLMSKSLLDGLKRQRVDLNQNFDQFSRKNKLVTLCRVMGLDEDLDDPDPTYELTTDNVLKLLAIHMRFRCGIPVVVMGETGCGKTRMVEFMSKLKYASKQKIDQKKHKNKSETADKPESIQNMMIVKVHGGITVSVIQKKMREAVELARHNEQTHNIDTILFLDEANTTEAIYAIKEYVCDRTINGERLQGNGLKVICACNPYRKHSSEAIQKMADAGLGFRVKNEDTTDKLGNIPMRCLVYRVIALPPSMHPLVWDFGQLSEEAEKVYVQQMVSKLDIHSQIDINLLVTVLCASQNFMRQKRTQCLFVSLRDVERCLDCFLWFRQSRWLYDRIDLNRVKPFPNFPSVTASVLRALIHAVGMCYHVTLEERSSYRRCVSTCINRLGCALSAEDILDEIEACQRVFSESLDLEDNIARNEALRENSFMIAMCTEMRIPLFLIGKPGSSKSLAKTVVTDAMQGPSSKNEVFQRLKQIHVLSFQCSAVSDAVGIENVFTQCAQVQESQDPEKFVSVVVLDEVGLAEDSPKMPLKVLHPLLEGSSIASVMKQADTSLATEQTKRATPTQPTNAFPVKTLTRVSTVQKDSNQPRRVGFVGISNWALDPAKMNRGIFVIRGDPTENDLQLTANGIFSSDDQRKFKEIGEIVQLLTSSYLKIREEQDQEFFGLRDYYGLLKMIFSVVKKDNVSLSFYHVSNAIKRNFSGGKVDCFDIFLEFLRKKYPKAEKSTVSIKKMIRDNLESVTDCESRFLLLLTNRFAAMNLIARIINRNDFQIIFGSSFPHDNDYTELCRNINKIKICMESGCTVVLLNLRDLYESLYDALNQHYVTFAGQRYVDLGLGGHRVKCRVSKEFRLIVIEDKDVVYNEFPIPLINRLEKYVFTSESILDGDGLEVAHQLRNWIEEFSELDIPMHKKRILKPFVVKQCFPGHNEDSAASAVLNANNLDDPERFARLGILNTATVDAVFRLQNSNLKKEASIIQQQFFFKQSHDNLVSLMKQIFSENSGESSLDLRSFAFEITSYSQILSENDRQTLEQALYLPKNSIMLLTLQQFDTQEEFNVKVESFFDFSLDEIESNSSPLHVLLIQCPQAQNHSNLIACARFCVKNLVQDSFLPRTKDINAKIFIAFLYTIDRQSVTNETSFSFHSSDFTSVFVDELRPTVDYIGPPKLLFKKSIGEIFQASIKTHNRKTAEIPSKFMIDDYLLDPIKLVKDCVSGAAVKVKARVESGQRHRVSILHQFLQGEHLAATPFQNIILKRISQLLNERDQKISDPLHWSIEEACSHESLYEGGTFSKTLWLRLKKLVTLVLAKIISILDEDNNMDILSQGKVQDPFLDFWLACFCDADEVCKFDLKEVLRNSNEFEVRGEGFSCHFPFSRRITECFSRLWKALQDCPVEQKLAMFYNEVSALKLSKIVLDIPSNKQVPLLKIYACDLVRLQYNARCINDLERNLVEDVLMSLFVSKRRSRTSDDEQRSSNFLAELYSIFASNRLQLEQLLSIVEFQPTLLTESNVEKWKSEQKSYGILIVHALVYQEALANIEKRFETFPTSKTYNAWKDSVRKVLNFTVDLSLLKAQAEPLQKIHRDISSMCDALSFIDLFLSVLMPDDVSDEEFANYLGILAPLANRLSKGAKVTGFSSARFLKLLMNILRSCSKKVYLNLLLSWKDLSCKCCKSEIVDPVIMPCDHYFCVKCIKTASIAGPKQCPMCRETFPDDFELASTKLSQEKMKKYNNFKQNCTSFFLQYLSTLCFPATNELTSDTVINHEIWNYLQDLVVRENNTRELTPMDIESFDETPTVRSYILHLLLRYNRENTQELLESHFQRMRDVLSNQKGLMTMYIRCVEDRLQIQANNAKALSLRSHQQYLEDLMQSIKVDYELADDADQIKVLDVVASVRYILQVASQAVHDVHGSKFDGNVAMSTKSFLRSVCAFLEQCSIPLAKNYFVKNLCRRFGFEDFQQLVNDDKFSSLVPSEINPLDLHNLSSQKSSFYLLGDDFSRAQSKLLTVESEDDFDSCIDALSRTAFISGDATVQILFAVQAWMNTASTDEGKSVRQDFFVKLIQKLKTHNASSYLLRNFSTILTVQFSQSDTSPMASDYTAFALQEFVLVASCTIASASGNILDDLQHLIKYPQDIESLFLPTMPHSAYFDVKDIVSQFKESYSKAGPKAYLCPNKHVYFIGDCTNPNEAGVCPECRKPIGGQLQQSNVLALDNAPGELQLSSQAGYLLGAPQNRSPSATPERNCTRLVVSTMRMFVHATMIFAAKNGDHITRHLKLNDEKSTIDFLFHHLCIDFQQFVDCVGKSVEDCVLLLHQIMKKMRTAEDVSRSYGSTLSTFEGRKLWEDDFHRSFLAQTFLRTDEEIEEARKNCGSAQKQNDLERFGV